MKSPVILSTTSSFSYQTEKIIQNPYKRKLTEEELVYLFEKYQPEILIAGVEPITANALNKATKLRIIARVGIGLDNVDLKKAKEKNIVVLNTPDAVTAPVAELAIGLLLTLVRKIHVSDRSIRHGQWERPMGNLLQNKVMGIIGGGRIGKYVAKLAEAFGMKVLIHDPFIKSESFIYEDDLKIFRGIADVISIHIPLSDQNRGFINKEFLAGMKKGSFIINTSRGELIDENALYDSLASGHLEGAGLDVFNEEPYNGKLIGIENTVLTAHIGSYAREARSAMEKQAFEASMEYWKNLN